MLWCSAMAWRCAGGYDRGLSSGPTAATVCQLAKDEAHHAPLRTAAAPLCAHCTGRQTSRALAHLGLISNIWHIQLLQLLQPPQKEGDCHATSVAQHVRELAASASTLHALPLAR